MGCGGSRIDSTAEERAKKEREEAEARNAAAAEEARRVAAAAAAAAQAARDAATAAAEAERIAQETEAERRDSSIGRANTNRNIVLSSLPTINSWDNTDDRENTLVFGNSITPTTPFTFTIRYLDRNINPPAVKTKLITLYRMPNELLIRNSIILFTYNTSVDHQLVILSTCLINLYESDIDPTNSNINTLISENRARKVPSQQRMNLPVIPFYNITLNSGKYYQAIIESQYLEGYAPEIHYRSSVKRYMGVDAFTNKSNSSSFEGYMENHPLLPKNYYPF